MALSIQTNLSSFNAQRNLQGTQGKLESALFTENLSAANSRIRDVDVASETSNLTRNQLLLQAGSAVLAQANAVPQVALQLLR